MADDKTDPANGTEETTEQIEAPLAQRTPPTEPAAKKPRKAARKRAKKAPTKERREGATDRRMGWRGPPEGEDDKRLGLPDRRVLITPGYGS